MRGWSVTVNLNGTQVLITHSRIRRINKTLSISLGYERILAKHQPKRFKLQIKFISNSVVKNCPFFFIIIQNDIKKNISISWVHSFLLHLELVASNFILTFPVGLSIFIWLSFELHSLSPYQTVIEDSSIAPKT